MRLDEAELDDPDEVMDVMTDVPFGAVSNDWNRAVVRLPTGRPVELRYVAAERPGGGWVGWQASRGGPFEDVDAAYVRSTIDQYGPVVDLELVERTIEDVLERYWDLEP